METCEKIISAIKWHIILYIDRKYPESCWANLVMWQMGFSSFKETFGMESRWNSQGCCEEHGGAWCSKCVRIGRLKE